jgi:hypothetical protein
MDEMSEEKIQQLLFAPAHLPYALRVGYRGRNQVRCHGGIACQGPAQKKSQSQQQMQPPLPYHKGSLLISRLMFFCILIAHLP